MKLFLKRPLKIPRGQFARMSPFHLKFNMIHPGQGVWEYQGPIVLGMKLTRKTEAEKRPSPPPQSSQRLHRPDAGSESMFHNLLTGENLRLPTTKRNQSMPNNMLPIFFKLYDL